MLVRLRSTSIALLSLVTAIGLGLTAFIAQLGWPGVFNGPIPGTPAKVGTVHGAIALKQEAGAPSQPRSGASPSDSASPARVQGASSGPSSESGLGGSRQLDESSDAGQAPTVGQPAATPAPAPAPEPASEPAAPSPVSSPPSAPPASSGSESLQTGVATEPKSSATSKSLSSSKASSPSTAKIKSDAVKSKTSSPAKSKAITTAKDYSGPSTKSTNYASGKYSGGHGTSSSKDATLPAATYPGKDAPAAGETDDFGATKDAGDSAGSDKPSH